MKAIISEEDTIQLIAENCMEELFLNYKLSADIVNNENNLGDAIEILESEYTQEAIAWVAWHQKKELGGDT